MPKRDLIEGVASEVDRLFLTAIQGLLTGELISASAAMRRVREFVITDEWPVFDLMDHEALQQAFLLDEELE